jgi:hypothetical protein
MRIGIYAYFGSSVEFSEIENWHTSEYNESSHVELLKCHLSVT